VDTSYHHAASESPTFGHSHDPEKAALGGGIQSREQFAMITDLTIRAKERLRAMEVLFAQAPYAKGESR